jgi:hypothetical protein
MLGCCPSAMPERAQRMRRAEARQDRAWFALSFASFCACARAGTIYGAKSAAICAVARLQNVGATTCEQRAAYPADMLLRLQLRTCNLRASSGEGSAFRMRTPSVEVDSCNRPSSCRQPGRSISQYGIKGRAAPFATVPLRIGARTHARILSSTEGGCNRSSYNQATLQWQIAIGMETGTDTRILSGPGSSCESRPQRLR